MARHTVSFSSHFKVFRPKPIWRVIMYTTLVISRFLDPNVYGASKCIQLYSFQGFYNQTDMAHHTVCNSSHFNVFRPKPIWVVLLYRILVISKVYAKTFMGRLTVLYSSHFKVFRPKPIWVILLYRTLVISKVLRKNLYGSSYCIVL